MPRIPKPVYEFGGYTLDAEDGSLSYRGEPVSLPPKAIDVLLVLIEESGNVVSKADLTKRAWSEEYVAPDSLRYQVFLIREQFRARDPECDWIETVSKRGFRFLPEVKMVQAPPSPAEKVEQELQLARPGNARPARSLQWTLVAAALGLGILVLAVQGVRGLRTGGVFIGSPEPLSQERIDPIRTPLLSDGDRVYFQSLGGRGTFSLPATGGVATGVFERPDYRLLDIHPTRSNYFFHPVAGNEEDRPLWVVPRSGGVPSQFRDISCSDASWSPDGRHLAVVTKATLWVYTDGKDRRQLPTPTGGVPRWLRWSPDGSVIRFTMVTPGDRTAPTLRLWEIQSDGRGLRPLLADWPGSQTECCGVWTRDGRFFVFQSGPEGLTDLWVREEGWLSSWFGSGELTRLTTGPLSFSGPAPGADANSLFAVGSTDRGELVRYDLKRREFSTQLDGLAGQWVTYSPDGSALAYISYPDRQLWRIRADGTDKRLLTTGPFETDGASWSPDGKWIAFRSRMSGKYMRIHLVPADGGVAFPISNEDREQGIPSWSSNGTRLVFGDVPAQFGIPEGNEAIYVYDLSRRTTSTVPGMSGELLWSPGWSPDGQFLLALTIVGQRLRIYSFASRTWRALAADHIENASWSRDGRFITYRTERGALIVRRVRVADGRVEDLVNLSKYPLVPYPWVGFSRDGSPLLLRNLGTSSVYELRLERR